MSESSIIEDFKKYLLEEFSNGGNDHLEHKVFFESLSHPITEDDLSDYSFSSLVNGYPDSDSESFIQNDQKLDELYKIILNGSRVLPGIDSTSFNQSKTDAQLDLKSYSLAPPSGIARKYLRSDQHPVGWFSNDNYWSIYKSGKSQNDLTFNTVKAVNRFKSNSSLNESKLESRINDQRNFVIESESSTTKVIELSLEYCVVRIDRKWMNNSIMNLYKNWYLPNYLQGSLSVNPIDFQFIPTAMIVIRSLEVKANWTSSDMVNLKQVNSLGLFSLSGSKALPEHGKIKNYQTQIIGWLCSSVQNLPPASDPTIQKSWIKIQHKGVYVAKFIVKWKIPNGIGGYDEIHWKSGKRAVGYKYKLYIPKNAKDINIKGMALRGVIKNNWNQIMSIDESSPTNKTYAVTGTIWTSDCEVS